MCRPTGHVSRILETTFVSSVINLEAICKTYATSAGAVPAVCDVSLLLGKGDFVAILGSSGSGKSTLLHITGCLDRPSSGRYRLEGVDVFNLDHDELADIRNQKIGFVFQGFNLLARTSALENVELPMLYARKHLTLRDQRERALHALGQVGLSDRADHLSNQLSGGQQQRVAIARALVNQPSLLLADEPTGHLDTRSSMQIMGVLQNLNERGITIVMVTHELDIARYARRNVVMRDGRIINDTAVAQRLDSGQELRRLHQAQEEMQLAS